MATCKIRIYQTHLTPSRNALVDNLDDYLASLRPRYSEDNFQYQQLTLDLVMKINVKQVVISGHNLGNYLTIQQDGKTWYYFILNTQWSGQQTVKLTLSIDSINTFRNDLTFNAKTSIKREHRDRLKKVNGELLRVIDYTNEGLNFTKVREDIEELRTEDDLDWYLIYKTADELSVNNLNNPVACYMCASKQINVGGGAATTSVDFIWTDLNEDEFYYFTLSDNDAGQFDLTTVGGTLPGDHNFVLGETYNISQQTSSTIVIAPRKLNGLIFYRKNNKMYYGLQFDGVGSYIIHGTTSYGLSTTTPTLPGQPPSEAAFDNYILAECSKVSFTRGNFLRFGNTYYDYSDTAVVNIFKKYPLYLGAGTNIMPFGDIDRTDSKIMKIIKLPYCPSDYTYVQGHYNFGEDWIAKQGLLQLKDDAVSKGFLDEDVVSSSLTSIFTVASVVDTTAVRNDYNESKLYHSNFYTYKFVYDSFAKEVKLENFNTYTSSDININITMKMTNTINSKFLFEFNFTQGGLDTTEDYEKYLVINRNNEETIYSNDYINYMRTGYNYDQKVRNQQLLMAGLNTGFSAASTGVAGMAQLKQQNLPEATGAGVVTKAVTRSLAISSAAGTLASLGSLVGSTINGIIGWAQAGHQIEQKQYELQQQATAVSGSDDLDLLSYYNGNRLNVITYKLKAIEEKVVCDLFYYTGYLTNKLEKPNLESRYWFNFIQCSPVFNEEGDTPYNDYIDDIKTRYESGVTVYHSHNGSYDWNQELENWEVSIL